MEKKLTFLSTPGEEQIGSFLNMQYYDDHLRNSRSIILIFMHSCQASEQFIVRDFNYSPHLISKRAQRFESGLPTAIQFFMGGIILEKTSDDETAVLRRTVFLDFQTVFCRPHYSSRIEEQLNHFVFIEI